MIHGTDAGDMHVTQDCSDAALPRAVHRSSSSKSYESEKDRKVRLAREEAEWAAKCGPVILKKVPKKG